MNNSSTLFTTVALVVILIFSGNLNAESIKVNGEDFKKAYVEFQEKYKEFGVSEKLEPYAKNAYEKAKRYYAKNKIELGIVTMNYAMTMDQHNSNKQNIAIIREAIEIFELQENIPTERLIQARIELARALSINSKSVKEGKKEFDKAIELAKETNNDLLIATTEKKVGISLMSTYFPFKPSIKAGIGYLKNAEKKEKYFSEVDKVNIQFWLGKGYGLLSENKFSSDYFEKVVAVKSEDKLIHKLAMISHAFLVETYSQSGNEELATKHCQAIGKSRSWLEDQDIEPVYILQPRYPRKDAMEGNEGWVKFAFTVTPNGFAEDISVVDSQGGILFVKSSKKVIKQWRFAPKFEDGKAVSAEATYTLEFKLR